MQVGELDTPAFLVDPDVLERNVRSMAEHAGQPRVDEALLADDGA